MSRRRTVPAGAVSLGLMLLAFSSLALARGFEAAPAKGVDLNGTWTLNVALSDDPKKILEAEREKLMGKRYRGPQTMADVVGSTPHRRPRPDRGDEIEMPAEVTIAHAADRFSISSPSPSGQVYKSEYRAGSKSVVSVPTGVADRNVGWKGRTFIISTRAVEGVNREDRYSLDKDGRLLVVTETRGEDIPKREVKRVYDRAPAQ